MSPLKHLIRGSLVLAFFFLAVAVRAAAPGGTSLPPDVVVSAVAAADETTEGPAFTAADYRAAFFSGMSLMALFEVGGLTLRFLRSARASGSLEVGG